MKNIIIILTFLFALSCKQEVQAQNEVGDVLSVEQFEQEIQSDDIQLLDVRTAEEYEEGYIGDATNIDVLKTDEFKQQIQKLDKSKPVYVYCRSGKRSQKAAEILEEEGFETIKDLDGGYNAWSEKH
ncbi:rhodanese-like domain-containing protein [Weeksellaceae bacterium KMM 9724]|uniref:rhodanese-like domain-containing protein n=1 Tax=Profundicola chukchiensis TaxID=2961959 RepID=UPI00243EA053|nr:rhodanese-like domain-containing protein [Profundicola chukchiensis]MDG4951475.1 rhodanese-like domain-containing protein [Profundicola chukchiensis]